MFMFSKKTWNLTKLSLLYHFTGHNLLFTSLNPFWGDELTRQTFGRHFWLRVDKKCLVAICYSANWFFAQLDHFDPGNVDLFFRLLAIGRFSKYIPMYVFTIFFPMKFQEGVCNTNIPVNKTLLNKKGKMLVFLVKRKKVSEQ